MLNSINKITLNILVSFILLISIDASAKSKCPNNNEEFKSILDKALKNYSQAGDFKVIMDGRLSRLLATNRYNIFSITPYSEKVYDDIGGIPSYRLGFAVLGEDYSQDFKHLLKLSPNDYEFSCQVLIDVLETERGNERRAIYLGMPKKERKKGWFR